MRLIDVDELIVKIQKKLAIKDIKNLTEQEMVVVKMIIDSPSVDVEPKRGEWVVNPNDGRPSGWKCNQCGFNGDSWDNFCRHCGADMRGNIK